MTQNQTTEAQRRYIESLAREVGTDVFAATFNRIHGGSIGTGTVNQEVKRMTKLGASRLIDALKAGGVQPVIEDDENDAYCVCGHANFKEHATAIREAREAANGGE
jgi:hypothetical protein